MSSLIDTVLQVLSKETKIAIAKSHVRMFSARLEGDSPNVRRGECLQYLRIWETAAADLEAEQPLSEDANHEFLDALLSGDYEKLMKADEVLKINEIIGDCDDDEEFDDDDDDLSDDE